MPRYREILSHQDMSHREKMTLQRGMNFRVRGGTAGYSIFLMSVRKGAPYLDQWHETGPHAGLLEYEGHDAPRTAGSSGDPKRTDQPVALPSGKPTDNGKFYTAAMAAKDPQPDGSPPAAPEIVQVYEKIADGVWCDRGRHELVDAEIKTVPVSPRSSRTRNVFRFYLRPTVTPAATTREDERELSISRQIPTAVKVEVWKRDHGCCVTCGATDNLHFDHDLPYSKGGSSITAGNVKLLCARHNLSKSDKIHLAGPAAGSAGGRRAGWHVPRGLIGRPTPRPPLCHASPRTARASSSARFSSRFIGWPSRTRLVARVTAHRRATGGLSASAALQRRTSPGRSQKNPGTAVPGFWISHSRTVYFISAACAAASLAIGTRNGEHDT